MRQENPGHAGPTPCQFPAKDGPDTEPDADPAPADTGGDEPRADDPDTGKGPDIDTGRTPAPGDSPGEGAPFPDDPDDAPPTDSGDTPGWGEPNDPGSPIDPGTPDRSDFPSPGETDADTDADADSDADTDTDADSDADTDTDADSDADTPAEESCDEERFGVLDDFAGLQLGGEKFTISSGSTVVTGDVGKAAGDILDFSGGGTISGTIYADAGVSVNISGGSSASGGTVTMDMSDLVADASGVSVTAAALAPDLSVASITNTTGTLTGTSGVFVIAVAGDLLLSGGSTLTLSGPADGYVVVNIAGTVTVSGGSAILLTGGLVPSHVLFNVTGSGTGVNFNGGSTTTGTFLALDRAITVSGGTHVGGFIAGGELKFQSGPTVTEDGACLPL